MSAMQVEQAPGHTVSPAKLGGQQTGAAMNGICMPAGSDNPGGHQSSLSAHNAHYQQALVVNDSSQQAHRDAHQTADYDQLSRCASSAAYQQAHSGGVAHAHQQAQFGYDANLQQAQSGRVNVHLGADFNNGYHTDGMPVQQLPDCATAAYRHTQAASYAAFQPADSAQVGFRQQAQADSTAVLTSSGCQGFAPDQAGSRPLQKAGRPFTSRPGFAVYQIPKRPEFRTRDVMKQLAVAKPVGASSRQSQQQAAAAPHQAQQPSAAQQASRQAQQPSVAQQVCVTQQAPRQAQQPSVAQQSQRQTQQPKPRGGGQQHTSRSSTGPAVMTMPRPANVPAALRGQPRAAVPAQMGSNSGR